MPASAAICALDDLGLLRFRGPDACKFLQGQLSNDIGQLGADAGLLAGYHNPQGRVLAILRLALIGADDVIAILPAELTEATAIALQRYVLRAKVAISAATRGVRIYGYLGDAPPTATGMYASRIGLEFRWLLADLSAHLDLTPAADIPQIQPLQPPPPHPHPHPQPQPQPPPQLPAPWVRAIPPLTREAWAALDIAAGLPQVYRATAGQFVAQMLNLDCVGGISFGKGCYTGQEVIARAHYRGRVKRRLQRFITRDTASLKPGGSGVFEDGRSFRIVDALVAADGRCEFLAVAATSVAAEEPGGDHTASGSAAGGDTALACASLPLPYPLPE